MDYAAVETHSCDVILYVRKHTAAHTESQPQIQVVFMTGTLMPQVHPVPVQV